MKLLTKRQPRPAKAARRAIHAADESCQTLDAALAEVYRIIPPLWGLSDYVAVNPFIGLAERSFLEAGCRLQDLRNCQFLMPKEFFRQCVASGRLNTADVEQGLEAARREHPDCFLEQDVRPLMEWLGEPDASTEEELLNARTISQQLDQRLGTQWSGHILNDITRHCAAHFDEGQASWTSPWRSESLYDAWREAACISRRMDLLGLKGFRSLVAGLPHDSRGAILHVLQLLEIPQQHWGTVLLRQASSVAGWASYLRNRDQQSQTATTTGGDLEGLVAIRLAYDAAVSQAFRPAVDPALCFAADESLTGPLPGRSTRFRYALQVALERSFQKRLLNSLATGPATSEAVARKAVQLVFCIDVRSEVIRRHIESLDAGIETFGFAGFFGAAIDLATPGNATGTAQCPVLIKPAYRVIERPRKCHDSAACHHDADPCHPNSGKMLRRSLKGSVCGGFSFVEAFGLADFGRLCGRLFTPRRSSTPKPTTLTLAHSAGQSDSDLNNTLTNLAESILRNLGLTSNFARTVVLCGHAASVINNPYKAALACGACGGHSGEPNARFVADLLNSPNIRNQLAGRGISIPDDCWFQAAVHETTTDTISFCDLEQLPESHREGLQRIRGWLDQASALCRQERSSRLHSSSAESLLTRGGDWSQVRPEWGLAGNAALIVAPRSKTRGLDLNGRAFLHSYERSRDPELKTLELILTAPMVVANWINLQYYASAVDPVAFGSGDKTIHNIVGRFGVLQGNGGDLMTGLPWQSVHDGERPQHEPLRLTVVVAAPRSDLETILRRHPNVRNLVTNGWVSLTAWEDGRFYLWTSTETWAECRQ